MRIRRLTFVLVPLAIIGLVYMLGPAPSSPHYDERFPAVPDSPDGVESFLRDIEAQHKLKPENEARIVWNDSSRTRTQYSIVYLHGFSASQKEGDPIHRRFAKDFGCNLLLARLSDHGVDTTDALYYFSADRAWESAKTALALSEKLGDRVVIISTSTGGTLALMLAARYPEKVHALINLSPNIAINDPAAFLLNGPWGLQIARAVLGGKNRETGGDEESAKYWYTSYRIEALVQLQELIETGMTDNTFHSIRQPSLTLYYYKNEEEQDPEVKVSAMLEMHAKLATPDSLKVAQPIPSAGAHVLGSSITSRDLEGVYAAIEEFALQKLHMQKRVIDPVAVAGGK
jgi:pimeloyl-ACP methyl ester carboxylesterase